VVAPLVAAHPLVAAPPTTLCQGTSLGPQPQWQGAVSESEHSDDRNDEEAPDREHGDALDVASICQEDSPTPGLQRAADDHPPTPTPIVPAPLLNPPVVDPSFHYASGR
jgi:hypothetical protein